MDKRQLRVKDLFSQLDEDGSGEISFKELQRGLVAMAAPSARLRAMAKKRKEKELAAEQEAIIRMKMEKELNERMERFEKSGAVKLLHRMEKYMHENNMRVKDLFTRYICNV
jgi:Ca2+-binding EF-hand superfamily protein